MAFRPFNSETNWNHLIDDVTGVQFFEKNWKAREKNWEASGEDLRESSVIFVFRDPSWRGDIEFSAAGISRNMEQKFLSGQISKFTQLAGFKIPRAPFDRSFQQYARVRSTEIGDIREYVVVAIRAYLTGIKEPVIEFS